jgi:5-methylcytosine-specific restriction endonuclease McrA
LTSRLKTFCNLIHVLNLYKHINNQLTFMLYYSYISNKAENSVLGDDTVCIYYWFLMAYFVLCIKMESGYLCYYCNEKFDLFKDIFNHLIEKHNAETFKSHVIWCLSYTVSMCSSSNNKPLILHFEFVALFYAKKL